MSDEPPDIEMICAHADDRESRLGRIVEETEPEDLMMWYSEVFVFAQLCELLGCSQVVESGRARGFSTVTLAEYFTDDVDVVSIEKESGTENAAIAEKKLGGYDNVELIYGDSRTVLPSIVDESTAVLIDGPKGDDALMFALELLDQTEVPFVAVHDLHKDTFYRELSEILFNYHLYTDADPLVDRFRQYDQTYFEWQKESKPPGQRSGPYRKNGVESASYGPTLGIFFNGKDASDERIRENYIKYIKDDEVGILSVARSWLENKRQNGGAVGRSLAQITLRFGRRVFR